MVSRPTGYSKCPSALHGRGTFYGLCERHLRVGRLAKTIDRFLHADKPTWNEQRRRGLLFGAVSTVCVAVVGKRGRLGCVFGRGKGKERAEGGGGVSLGSKIDRVADDLRLVATEEADDLSMDDSRLNGSDGIDDR